MTNRDLEFGIIIPAYGAEYVQMAAVAAVSAREAGNECPIHLHTNIAQASSSKILSGIFDKIVVEDEPNNHCLYVKIEAYNRSPFHKTLVMDADQIVLKKIDDALKSILDGFEICAPLRCTPARVKYSLPGLDSQEQFSHWNTGVFAFKKTKNIEYLFETWHEIHHREQWKPDQPSFAKAVWLNPKINFLTLDLSWGWLPKYRALEKQIRGQVKIIHYVDVNHEPAAARRILEIDAQFRRQEGAETQKALCLSEKSRKRYRFIGSKIFDNPITPILRATYNSMKPALGIEKKFKFLHKERAWKVSK